MGGGVDGGCIDPSPIPLPQGEGGLLHLGVVWAGRPEHWDDARRSLPFAALAPLWAVRDVRWFSLQVGPRAADLAGAPPGVMTDLGPLLTDFADTAAAVSVLDLVVCVDTAVAHLAGALGRPAWLLLPHAADWRWMRDPDATVWYPSVRLFRQDGVGDWDGVVRRVAGALGGGADASLHGPGPLRPDLDPLVEH